MRRSKHALSSPGATQLKCSHVPGISLPEEGQVGEDGLSSVKEERGINQRSQALNAITKKWYME